MNVIVFPFQIRFRFNVATVIVIVYLVYYLRNYTRIRDVNPGVGAPFSPGDRTMGEMRAENWTFKTTGNWDFSKTPRSFWDFIYW